MQGESGCNGIPSGERRYGGVESHHSPSSEFPAQHCLPRRHPVAHACIAASPSLCPDWPLPRVRAPSSGQHCYGTFLLPSSICSWLSRWFSPFLGRVGRVPGASWGCLKCSRRAAVAFLLPCWLPDHDIHAAGLPARPAPACSTPEVAACQHRGARPLPIRPAGTRQVGSEGSVSPESRRSGIREPLALQKPNPLPEALTTGPHCQGVSRRHA